MNMSIKVKRDTANQCWDLLDGKFKIMKTTGTSQDSMPVTLSLSTQASGAADDKIEDFDCCVDDGCCDVCDVSGGVCLCGDVFFVDADDTDDVEDSHDYDVHAYDEYDCGGEDEYDDYGDADDYDNYDDDDDDDDDEYENDHSDVY